MGESGLTHRPGPLSAEHHSPEILAHSPGLRQLANDPQEKNQREFKFLDSDQCSCLLPQTLWSWWDHIALDQRQHCADPALDGTLGVTPKTPDQGLRIQAKDAPMPSLSVRGMWAPSAWAGSIPWMHMEPSPASGSRADCLQSILYKVEGL